jgi:hypothetical protein
MIRVLALALLLGGCDATAGQLSGGAAAISVGSIVALHRSPIDAVYSLFTGKDCSVVRLEENKSYCRTPEPLPGAPPYCTRSLGVVDCWLDPAQLPDHPPQVADGPMTLTPEQNANRTRHWPWF